MVCSTQQFRELGMAMSPGDLHTFRNGFMVVNLTSERVAIIYEEATNTLHLQAGRSTTYCGLTEEIGGVTIRRDPSGNFFDFGYLPFPVSSVEAG